MKITEQTKTETQRRLNHLLQLQGTRQQLRSDKRYIRHYRKELGLE